MTTFMTLTIVGIVVGCIYALSATGLVVTYITSGIFNFAHGAVGMIAAFTYWKLVVDEGWPALLALPFILFVFAPLLGVLIDALIMRNLHGASEEVRVIVTVALMLALLVTLDVLLLTLLVINGYAAAVAGRLKSLPLTFAGGVALGLLESYVVGYAPGNLLSYFRPTIPIIFLYVLLLIFPETR